MAKRQKPRTSGDLPHLRRIGLSQPGSLRKTKLRGATAALSSFAVLVLTGCGLSTDGAGALFVDPAATRFTTAMIWRRDAKCS